MPEKSSVFDMIGPVMIGPPSYHTAGVVRIGRAALKVKDAFRHAEAAGLKVQFKSVGNAPTLHPNTIRLHRDGFRAEACNIKLFTKS